MKRYDFVSEPLTDDFGFQLGPGLAVAKKGKQWGFVSYIKGSANKFDLKELIEPIYDTIPVIEEGLIKVSKHGKYGLLDIAVNLVFRCVFDSIQVVNHERIIAKFEGKWGIITIEKNQIVPFYYDGLSYYNDNIISVKYNGLCGVIDIKGKYIVPILYDRVQILDDYIMVYKDGKCGLYTQDGNFILNVQYDNIKMLKKGFVVYLHHRAGYINEDGVQEISFNKYDDIEQYSVDNAAILKVKRNSKYGLVDLKDNLLLPCRYKEIEFQSWPGPTPAMAENGKWTYIDYGFKQICPAKYDTVTNFDDGIAVVSKEGKWGAIDLKGNEVVKCIWDDLSLFNEYGFAEASQDDRVGVINTKGELVTDIIFTSVTLKKNIAKVTYNNIKGYVCLS